MQKYLEAIDIIVEALKTYKSYDEMICHFPDIKEKE